MALDPEEQELLDVANASLPPWFRGNARAQEDAGMAAKTIGAAKKQIGSWFGQSLVKNAEGIWLEEHAKDRGSGKQEGESTAALRDRLRNIPDAITVEAILNAVQGILDADGVAGTISMVELPRDGAFFIDQVQQNTGTGGTFSGPVSNVMTFTPTVRFSYPPYRNAPGRVKKHRIVLSGCADAGNNGTFDTIGMSGNGVTYTNAAGVAGADATAAWATQRIDHDDQVIEGWARAFFSRGFRRASTRLAMFVVLLPYGTGPETERSILEAVRQIKVAGAIVRVERRSIAP